jgi:hypothetical protein
VALALRREETVLSAIVKPVAPFTVSIAPEIENLVKRRATIAPLTNLPANVARVMVAKSRLRVNEVAQGLADLLKKRAGRSVGMSLKAGSLVTAAGRAGSKTVRGAVGAQLETGFFPPGLVGKTGRSQGLRLGLLFSPFTVRVWDKKTGGLFGRSTKSGGLKDAKLVKGRYQFVFKIPKTAIIPFIETNRPIPIKISGKRSVIEAARIDNAAGTLKVQLNVVENFILVVSAIAVVGAALGVGGWGVKEALTSVDRVIVNTANNAWKLVLTGGAVFAGLKIFKVI